MTHVSDRTAQLGRRFLDSVPEPSRFTAGPPLCLLNLTLKVAPDSRLGLGSVANA